MPSTRELPSAPHEALLKTVKDITGDDAPWSDMDLRTQLTAPDLQK